KSEDLGQDIIITIFGMRIVVQCKARYSKEIGRDKINEFRTVVLDGRYAFRVYVGVVEGKFTKGVYKSAESFFIGKDYDIEENLDSWDYIRRPMTTFNTTYRIIQFLQNYDEIGDISFIGSIMKPGEVIKIHDCTYLTSKNNKDPELPNYNHIMFIAGDNGSTKDAEDYCKNNGIYILHVNTSIDRSDLHEFQSFTEQISKELFKEIL
ncbi:45871_t:CDS:2, partial [Gigaspora margarita]